MRRPHRAMWFRMSMLFALLFVLSCSDDSTGPDPEDGGPKPATATITPADGGTVVATVEDGSRVRLTFPPGAVRVPTAVTVRPLDPTGNNWVNVALEPAGMVFYEPFDIAVTLSDDVSISNPQLFLRPQDPLHIATDVDGRTLRGALRFFGFSADSTRVIPAVAGRDITTQTGGGNNLGAGAVNCDQLIASTEQRFNGFLAINEFERAIEAAMEIATILQTAACPGAQDWINTAKSVACDALSAELQDAQSTPTVTYGDFRRQSEGILNWAGTVSQLDPTCDALASLYTVLGAEITDFLSFFQPRLNGLTANDWGTFQDLKEEAGTVFDLMTSAQMLGLSDAYDALETDAFLPTVDQMRTIAYNMCDNDGWHYPLSRLTPTGFFARRDIVGTTPPRRGVIWPAPSQYANFSAQDIFDDIQYCATKLEIESVVASGTPYDTLEVGSNGAAGQHTAQGALTVPTRGQLSIGGAMGAFGCWDDIDGDTELVFELSGTEVLSLRRPVGQMDYLQGGTETIDIIQAAQTAGITASEGSSHELKIIRKRTRCDERLWGDATYTVGTATLNWKNPTLDTEVTMTDTMQARSSAEVTVRVKVIDQLGQAGFFEGIDIALNVAGGVADLVSGQTDSQGYFRTRVTPNNPGFAAISAAAAQGNLSVTAVATSFEGVSAQDSKNATVLPCAATDARFRDGGSGQKTLEWGHLKASASARADEYVYAATEWIDDYAVYPSDQSLNGQDGYMYVKVHYKFTSTGYSNSNPAARVVIGPRNGFSSPYFWENKYNTPGGTQENVVEGDWEIRLSCRFGGSSAPLDVNCDAFARGTDAPTTVTAELTWMGITKVTKLDGTVVSNYRFCSGSGTDWRLPQ